MDANPENAAATKVSLDQIKGDTGAVELVRHIQDARARLKMGAVDFVLMTLGVADDANMKESIAAVRASTDAVIIVILDRMHPAFAFECLRAGAEDYLVSEGLDPALVYQTLDHARMRHQLRYEQSGLETRVASGAITGVSVFRIVSLSREATVAVNDQGAVIFANDVACAAMTMPLDDICGQPLLRLLDRMNNMSAEVGTVMPERLCDCDWDGETAHVILLGRS